MSLPFCVTVHTSNQEVQAWATIIWDNATSEQHRTQLSVGQSVTWKQLSQVISSKFKEDTESELSLENHKFLCKHKCILQMFVFFNCVI